MGLLTERAALREDAARLLDELGGTVSEVAESLGSMGIQVRSSSSPHDSPAARYLHAVIGGDNRVRQVKVNTRWLVLRPTEDGPGHLDATSAPVIQLTVDRPGFGGGTGYWVDSPMFGWF